MVDALGLHPMPATQEKLRESVHELLRVALVSNDVSISNGPSKRAMLTRAEFASGKVKFGRGERFVCHFESLSSCLNCLRDFAQQFAQVGVHLLLGACHAHALEDFVTRCATAHFHAFKFEAQATPQGQQAKMLNLVRVGQYVHGFHAFQSYKVWQYARQP